MLHFFYNCDIINAEGDIALGILYQKGCFYESFNGSDRNCRQN